MKDLAEGKGYVPSSFHTMLTTYDRNSEWQHEWDDVIVMSKTNITGDNEDQ